MRSTETVTISLPPAMLTQLEKVRKKENRTRSELTREALRQYFESHYPVYIPTKMEAAAIKRGRAAFTRGTYVTLAELIHELDTAGHQARKKRSRRAS
jgi:metal-responsive CopG/Arc/MetJ family transcriptional regulator